MLALDEGYEGFGWKVFESGRALGPELKASLAKSLLDYFNDPTVPTSGDELTFFMTKEIMNRLAPSLLVVNFWDIDIAHYGAYSLYLEAIKRTDRLVHELWQHAQSLPQYRDRTTLLVVPELGRDGDVAGNGFANHRSGDESCRRVWLVAVGAGVPKGRGHGAPDSDDGRRADGRGHPGVQDAGVRGTSPRRTGVLNLVEAASTQLLTMQFDAGLVGDAAALARAHAELLARLPATVHAFIVLELQKWPTLFAAERRYQRALLDELARFSRPDLQQATAGIARVETEAGCDKIARGNPGRFQDEAQALLRKRKLLPDWRKEIDAFFQRLDPALEAHLYPPDAPRRLVVQIYGSGIGVQTEKLWHRFKGTGFRVPLNLEDARGPETFLRKLFGAADGRTAALFSALKEAERSNPLHAWVVECQDALHGLCSPGTFGRRARGPELRPSENVPRRTDARAVQQDPERRREPASLRGVRPRP